MSNSAATVGRAFPPQLWHTSEGRRRGAASALRRAIPVRTANGGRSPPGQTMQTPFSVSARDCVIEESGTLKPRLMPSLKRRIFKMARLVPKELGDFNNRLPVRHSGSRFSLAYRSLRPARSKFLIHLRLPVVGPHTLSRSNLRSLLRSVSPERPILAANV